MQRRNVLVVGAGPVGSVAALACARRGHTVALLEAQEKIDDSPRASTTQPPTLELLAELGLVEVYNTRADESDEEALSDASVRARLSRIGLGLNCGIHEAWDLAELLDRVLRGEAHEGSLDAYEARRRPLNIEYVQEQTVANKKRLEERDPAQRARRFQQLRETAGNPERHKAFLMRASLLESTRRAIRT